MQCYCALGSPQCQGHIRHVAAAAHGFKQATASRYGTGDARQGEADLLFPDAYFELFVKAIRISQNVRTFLRGVTKELGAAL